MKKTTILMTLILTLTLVAGCGSTNDPATTSQADNNTATIADAGNTQHTSTATDTNNTQHTSTAADTNNTQHTTTAADAANNSGSTDHIGEDRAKEIALTHAGIAADQVTFVKSGFDRENGNLVYDVEFYSKDHTEYDYKIDAYTGEVLSYDHDAEYYPNSDTTTPADAIGEAKAKELALAKVPGAAESDIREFKMDYDNGRLEYEGKIYYDHKEYEFEIDGHTGDFKNWDEETIYQ